MQINGPALAAIRERTGYSQSDLARRSGISQTRISEVEAGERGVRPGTARSLAEALGVPLAAILADVAA